ncbi:MAG: DNA repair protein RadA [Acidimicrobiales bacterium]
MARNRTVFRCGECGGTAPQWVGRCPSCGEWNTLVEERAEPSRGVVADAVDRPVPITDVDLASWDARPTGVAELDRVLGGGVVPGSVTLVGGEPGVGKSTLLLQATAAMAAAGARTLYVSAEESKQQVRLRAERLGTLPDGLWLASETSLPNLLAHLDAVTPDVVVIDSIQTVHDPDLGSAPGSVAQVRECAAALVREAKQRELCVILVGHVTKEGGLAGPRVLEHVVDTVLTFDGDRHHALRLLRAVKHRFGATDELGLLQMTERGLEAVPDPSDLFLADRRVGVSGSVVTPALAGHRPLLVEVQSLAVHSSLPAPRRSAQGLDAGRLAVLLAVLERRCGIRSGDRDIYALAVGGVKLVEPAADLALALAVASSLIGDPLPRDVVAIGEVGLAGEVRQVAQLERRLAEAARLGFTRALVPRHAPPSAPGIEVVRVGSVLEALVAAGLADLVEGVREPAGRGRDDGRRAASGGGRAHGRGVPGRGADGWPGRAERRSGGPRASEGHPVERILRAIETDAVGDRGPGPRRTPEPDPADDGPSQGADDQAW